MHEERQGELYIFLEAALWGLFPVITILSLNTLAPLVSLAWSVVFAVMFFAIVISVRKRWHELTDRIALADILWVTLFIGILYYAFYFFGLRFTSAGNAGIIALTEVFFSYLFFHVWRKDAIPVPHILGALLMLAGAAIVLSPNFTHFHSGDLLIVAASFVAPFGNFFQRRARQRVSSETIMFVRSLMSAPILFALALLLNGRTIGFDLHRSFWFLFVNGFVLLGLSKVFWVEGIHRISVTKANALGTISPVMTLLFVWLIMHNPPTPWQLAALVPMAAGVILLGVRKKEPVPSKV